MNTAYKLVVIHPFENYKRGDVILDQNVVQDILDPANTWHSYEGNVRRVMLSEDEMNVITALQNVNIAQEIVSHSDPVHTETGLDVHLSSDMSHSTSIF